MVRPLNVILFCINTFAVSIGCPTIACDNPAQRDGKKISIYIYYMNIILNILFIKTIFNMPITIKLI